MANTKNNEVATQDRFTNFDALVAADPTRRGNRSTFGPTTVKIATAKAGDDKKNVDLALKISMALINLTGLKLGELVTFKQDPESGQIRLDAAVKGERSVKLNGNDKKNPTYAHINANILLNASVQKELFDTRSDIVSEIVDEKLIITIPEELRFVNFVTKSGVAVDANGVELVADEADAS